MHKIEVLKAVLSKYVFRTHSPDINSMRFMCLHTYSAVIKINKKFPEYNKDFLFKVISEEITIKEGKLTSFIWGYSKCARRIYNFEKIEKIL